MLAFFAIFPSPKGIACSLNTKYIDQNHCKAFASDYMAEKCLLYLKYRPFDLRFSQYPNIILQMCMVDSQVE